MSKIGSTIEKLRGNSLKVKDVERGTNDEVRSARVSAKLEAANLNLFL